MSFWFVLVPRGCSDSGRGGMTPPRQGLQSCWKHPAGKLSFTKGFHQMA